jgi:hypothetical protein
MKLVTSIQRTTTSLAAAALMAAGAMIPMTATAQALQGSVNLRPLTPQEIKDYSLTGTQGASGLSAVGVGQPAYLDALVNAAIAPSNILSVTFVLTNKPIGSMAELAPSPLGTNVPTYKMADRYNNSGAKVYQVAGRTMLRPDVTGQYTVAINIVCAGTSGSTNLTQVITAGTYLGVRTCALCHSGGVLENIYKPWSETAHASFFTRQIDGGEDPATTHYASRCISCHVVGYDANTNAVNGGFDDVAKQLGWVFPAVLTNGNWAAMPTALQNLANIQCENCHGPGSEHAYALGNTNISNWPRLGVSFGAGNCAQCHDSKPNHVRNIEWNASKHAVATRTPSGPTRAQCVRCHTAGGFAAWADTLGTTNYTGTSNTVSMAARAYEAVTCAACHDPHAASNPYQLRTPEFVALGDGANVAMIEDAGSGAICMNCHQSRSGSYTNSLVGYPLGKPTYPGGSSSFGPHDNPAAEMVEGVNGYTYGQVIPSSAHRSAVSNTCAGCHMQPVAMTDPGWTKVGGHTFGMTYTVVTNGVTNIVEKVDVCVKCHGEIESFDMIKVDYNGDGIIEGIQTEVTKLYDKLSTLLPPSAYKANPADYKADGLVKSPSVKTNWPAKFLQATWNYQLVKNDLSKGIHNSAYAVGLLKASIGNLTGDNNNDGLADEWQVQYFGSANATNAAPNACPAGDNIPNWLKFGLGLDPRIAGIVVPDGVVWANGSKIGGGTNTIHIYTAAEIAFDTEMGVSYQIQAISTLGGGWKDVGAPIPGTGSAISYVTPTRSKLQQYYRVVHTP